MSSDDTPIEDHRTSPEQQIGWIISDPAGKIVAVGPTVELEAVAELPDQES